MLVTSCGTPLTSIVRKTNIPSFHNIPTKTDITLNSTEIQGSRAVHTVILCTIFIDTFIVTVDFRIRKNWAFI